MSNEERMVWNRKKGARVDEQDMFKAREEREERDLLRMLMKHFNKLTVLINHNFIPFGILSNGADPGQKRGSRVSLPSHESFCVSCDSDELFTATGTATGDEDESGMTVGAGFGIPVSGKVLAPEDGEFGELGECGSTGASGGGVFCRVIGVTSEDGENCCPALQAPLNPADLGGITVQIPSPNRGAIPGNYPMGITQTG
ncbi:hypothetical protein C8R42DRAFT_643840 [Lentinula raphanica]|nr:hypothetical protein C8R42DRAFT_643840 [Lentinula raphanica]